MSSHGPQMIIKWVAYAPLSVCVHIWNVFINISIYLTIGFLVNIDKTIFGNIKLSGQVATITVGVIIGFIIVTTILLVVGMVVKFKKCSNFRSKSRMSPSLGPLTSGSHQSQGIIFYYIL